jgi:hypothetical protein
MNNFFTFSIMKYLLATLVALATTVFAGVNFGVRAGYNVNNFSFGYEEFGKNIDMGYGFGVGLALNVPIVSIVRLNAGVDFYWREFFEGEVYYYLGSFGDMQEVAVSIPVTLQFGNSIYLAAGAQLDIPVFTWNGYERDSGEHFAENRQSRDFGLVLGLGYRVDKIELDLKCVYGLTNLFKDFIYKDEEFTYYDYKYKDKSWLGQYGLGLTYFF